MFIMSDTQINGASFVKYYPHAFRYFGYLRHLVGVASKKASCLR